MKTTALNSFLYLIKFRLIILSIQASRRQKRLRKTFNGDVSVLPTAAYYYGLRDKEEVNVHLEEGKTLFIRLHNITEPDANGVQFRRLDGYVSPDPSLLAPQRAE